MDTLPLLIDEDDAVDLFNNGNCNDTIKAYVVHYLSNNGLSNRQIRDLLGIDKVYTVTHLRRAGSLSEGELLLWMRNPKCLTLGHIRAISQLPAQKRENAIRNQLRTKHSVRQLEKLVKNVEIADINTKHYVEEMSTSIGFKVELQHNQVKGGGKLSIFYHSLDELQGIAEKLGYHTEE